LFFSLDILIGFPAFVGRETGTKFGSILAENLIKRSHYQDLDKILKRVSLIFNTTYNKLLIENIKNNLINYEQTLSQLNKQHDSPNAEEVENIIKNSENVVHAFRELQKFSFPVFSIETALPKHLYFNLRPKRSFVLNELPCN